MTSGMSIVGLSDVIFGVIIEMLVARHVSVPMQPPSHTKKRKRPTPGLTHSRHLEGLRTPGGAKVGPLKSWKNRRFWRTCRIQTRDQRNDNRPFRRDLWGNFINVWHSVRVGTDATSIPCRDAEPPSARSRVMAGI